MITPYAFPLVHNYAVDTSTKENFLSRPRADLELEKIISNGRVSKESLPFRINVRLNLCLCNLVFLVLCRIHVVLRVHVCVFLAKRRGV